MRQLTGFQVIGLLGQFNHELDFTTDHHVTIVYGPNGIGKTKILEIIQAALKPSLRGLSRIPFSYASLRFSDGHKLEISKSSDGQQPAFRDEDDRLEALVADLDVEVRLQSPNGLATTWSPRDDLDETTERGMTWLSRADQRQLALRDLPERESRRLRDRELAFALRHRRTELIRPPVWLTEFCQGFPAHLVRTQRLVIGDGAADSSGGNSSRTAVQAYREDLSARIREALAENSKTTARLDRTFPRRIMLDDPTTIAITDAEIRRKYQTQSGKRTALSRVGLADNAEELPLPDRELAPLERKVLWTYLQDMDKKLKTFDALLARVETFVEIVNSKFLYKTMSIDQDEGFSFWTNEGRPIPVDGLSSGEQHELVLAYSLLFKTVPGSLVMIDEPEISLHVVWQQQFISDLDAISTVVPMQFLIATHSPQVINKWWNRAVALEPNDSLFA